MLFVVFEMGNEGAKIAKCRLELGFRKDDALGKTILYSIDHLINNRYRLRLSQLQPFYGRQVPSCLFNLKKLFDLFECPGLKIGIPHLGFKKLSADVRPGGCPHIFIDANVRWVSVE